MSILSGGVITRPGRAFVRSICSGTRAYPCARAAKPSVAVSAPLVLDGQSLPSSRWATLAPSGARASIASRISRFGEMPRPPSWPSSFAPGPMTALEMAECSSTRTHASSRGPCRPSSQRRTGYRSGRRRWRSSWAEHVAAFRSSGHVLRPAARWTARRVYAPWRGVPWGSCSPTGLPRGVGESGTPAGRPVRSIAIAEFANGWGLDEAPRLAGGMRRRTWSALAPTRHGSARRCARHSRMGSSRAGY